MKKYFTKYLPVEGSYKVGELVIDLHHPEPRIHEADRDCAKQRCKKVKLFLCSRDMHKGDKVWWDDPDGGQSSRFYTVYFEPEGDLVYLVGEHSEAEVPLEEVYKVIGEISPADAWVKEGDEFYEKQVQILVTDPNEPEWLADYYSKGDWKEELDIGFNIVAKILGPCNYFH